MSARAKTPYWTLAIERAEKRKPVHFTITDRVRASKWTTCACGRQDGIPRDSNRAPLDETLWILGLSFARAVETDDPGKAERVLAMIEARAAVVLAGLPA